MIEAAIQQGDLGTGGYEAWILLGEVRSMDEREEAAMRALKEGVKLAEAVGASGEGMLVCASLLLEIRSTLNVVNSHLQFRTQMSPLSVHLIRCC